MKKPFSLPASKLLLHVTLFAAVGLFAVPFAEAAQRVHFKNGHVLVVDSAREEGDTVFLKLSDGNEVGFPKSLIAEVESKAGIRVSRADRGGRNSVRGPGLADLAPAPGSTRAHGTPKRQKIIDSGFDSERNPDLSGAARMGYGRYGSSVGQNARRPALEQMSVREARRIRDKQRATVPVIDPDNPEESTGPMIAKPKLARPTTRETGQKGSGKR